MGKLMRGLHAYPSHNLHILTYFSLNYRGQSQLKATRAVLNKILENMEQLCSLKEISTFQELLNLEEIRKALNSAKQANSQKASIFLRHLETLTGQEETPTDKSIERILSTVRPEKLLNSLKDFVDGRRWMPFLKKTNQEENVEAVG